MSSVNKTLLPDIVAGAAVRDGNGKKIDSTYATKAQLESLASKVPLVVVPLSETSITMDPNKFYDFSARDGSMGTTISFSAETPNEYNEYFGQIIADEAGTTVVFPSGIVWDEDPQVSVSLGTLTLTAKYTYHFSVVDKKGLIKSFANGTLVTPTVTLTDHTISWPAVANAETYVPVVAGVSQSEQTELSYDLDDYVSTLYEDYGSKLPAPTGLVTTSILTGTSSSTVSFGWNAVPKADKYTLQRSQGGIMPTESDFSSNNTSVLLTNGNVYTIAVKSKRNSESKSYSVKAKSKKYIDSVSSSGTYSYTAYQDSDYSQSITVRVPWSVTYSLSKGNQVNVEDTFTHNGEGNIAINGTRSFTLSVTGNNRLPNSITVVNADHTYDNTTGAATLSNPTGNVTVYATLTDRNQYTITCNTNGVTASGDTVIYYGGTATVSLEAAEGFTLPSSITVTGNVTYTYDNGDGQTGSISLSNPTGQSHITITITGEAVSE